MRSAWVGEIENNCPHNVIINWIEKKLYAPINTYSNNIGRNEALWGGGGGGDCSAKMNGTLIVNFSSQSENFRCGHKGGCLYAMNDGVHLMLSYSLNTWPILHLHYSGVTWE